MNFFSIYFVKGLVWGAIIFLTLSIFVEKIRTFLKEIIFQVYYLLLLMHTICIYQVHVRVWYMHTVYNDQIRVFRKSITSSICYSFVFGTFQIFSFSYFEICNIVFVNYRHSIVLLNPRIYFFHVTVCLYPLTNLSSSPQPFPSLWHLSFYSLPPSDQLFSSHISEWEHVILVFLCLVCFTKQTCNSISVAAYDEISFFMAE